MKAVGMLQYFLRVSSSLQTGAPSQQPGHVWRCEPLHRQVGRPGWHTQQGASLLTLEAWSHSSTGEFEAGLLKAWHPTGHILAALPKLPTIKSRWTSPGVPGVFQRIQCSACPRSLTALSLTVSVATSLVRRIFQGGSLTSTSRKRQFGFLSTEGMEKRLMSFPNRVIQFWCTFSELGYPASCPCRTQRRAKLIKFHNTRK